MHYNRIDLSEGIIYSVCKSVAILLLENFIIKIMGIC